ncbi:MAG: EAL domain-containing protein, partial [Gammaproteobacteria bacterium]
LLPHRFLPLAEETGFIVQLGQWVLERACGQFAAWRGAGLGPEVRLGINLSLRELRERGLAERMLATLGRHGIGPEAIELELPEAISACDDPGVQRSLRTLAEAGLRFCLDDFGTGYSSLTCLRRLPVDELKIDRSFVQGLGRDPDQEAVVRAAVSLGRSLRLRVVAEGVETEAQRRLLMEAGCELLQGQLLAEPMPAERTAAFLGLPEPLRRQA